MPGEAVQFLSEASVAGMFDVSPATVRRWVEKGVLPPPVQIGSVKRWAVTDLMRAVSGALDQRAGRPSDDADEATRRIARNAEAKRASAHTRGRHR